MKIGRLVLVVASVATLCLIVACSDDKTETTGNGAKADGGPAAEGGSSSGTSGSTSSSSSSSSSGGADQCKVPDGKYTITSTARGGETATCKNSTITTDYPPDGGADQPLQPGCVKTSENKATCNTVIDCDIKTSGFTTKVHAETTIKAGLPEGSTTSKTTKDSDGSVLAECTSDFKWTK